METGKVQDHLKKVIENTPSDWLNLTTHRLDIYNEKLAKTEFLNQFEELFNNDNGSESALKSLPTAYDYIRLGHPLSSVLEWGIARLSNSHPDNVISFSSKTIPVLAILRKNLLENKSTHIFYSGDLPAHFDAEVIKNVYGYNFDLTSIEKAEDIPKSEDSTIFISSQEKVGNIQLTENIDFYVDLHGELGSILIINGKKNKSYISDIQHVRRRETISMTPANCFTALQSLVNNSPIEKTDSNIQSNKKSVQDLINKVTGTNTKSVVASSGLSMQYAIMMGLTHAAMEEHPGKEIKFIVPPNCYGGTNDQARRVAACLDNVHIVDLPVDGDNDMVKSIDLVLNQIAKENAIPYIIAEIPTNPRVEVPNLSDLEAVLIEKRKTDSGEAAIEPVFILDQTFCPDVHFLGEGKTLSSMKALSYVSGSKFPSGGKCTAGYCVGNTLTTSLMDKIEEHLNLCDNEATGLQYKFLAEQMPSMNQRILDAYKNTREFVNFIEEVLPTAKINFVSEELAEQGFTPSVFSLDLPTKGETAEEKETYKRALNLKLINLMISEIPNESKFCVSYGQLKGCYWTIPATSTQGTTKEGDKDYIVRVSLSGDMDLELHKKVFMDFVNNI